MARLTWDCLLNLGWPAELGMACSIWDGPLYFGMARSLWDGPLDRFGMARLIWDGPLNLGWPAYFRMARLTWDGPLNLEWPAYSAHSLWDGPLDRLGMAGHRASITSVPIVSRLVSAGGVPSCRHKSNAAGT